MKEIFSLRNISIAIGIIVIDLAIYIFLGILLMSYDDFYDENKGEYFSLESMTFWQKANYISLELWNVINIILIAILLYRLVLILKSKRSITNIKS